VSYTGEEGVGSGVTFAAICDAVVDMTGSSQYQRRMLPSPFAIEQTWEPVTKGLFPPVSIRGVDLGIYEALGAAIWGLVCFLSAVQCCNINTTVYHHGQC